MVVGGFMLNAPFVIADQIIQPGMKVTVLYPAPNINSQIKVDIPVHVYHGKYKGPTIFIMSGIHGDELNSIEVVRRVSKVIKLKKLHGTIIILPVANIYGLIMQSRYMPDRRDLNRSFPGSKKGSMASRLAHSIIKQIVSRCDCGIDLHTGAYGRMNMPQLRVNLDNPEVKRMALAFGVPVILDCKTRDGSLREVSSKLGIPILVYEGGEALRYNESCIRGGVLGVCNVMSYLGMLNFSRKGSERKKPLITRTSRWVRAPVSGFIQPVKSILTKAVKKGMVLGYVHDPFLINKSVEITAPFDGIVIGQTLKPLASEGEALFNIASFKKIKGATESIEDFKDLISDR